MTFVLILTAILLFLIFWTYAGYYLYLKHLAKKKHPELDIAPNYSPKVTIIFAAYNEEKIIEEKLKNHLSLDYPKDKLEILVATDLYSDKTNEIIANIAAKHENIIHVKGETRKGKCATINAAIEKAHGELFIFTDANTMFDKNAVKELAKYFNDKSVGLVCGELRLKSPDENIGGKGESLYWKYETQIKKLSGSMGALIGATGGIYAIRSELFEPFPTDRLIMDDFWLGLRIRLKGFKALYEGQALAHEYTSWSIEDEWSRKVRIGLANYNVMDLLEEALDFRKHPFLAFQYFSHKILRWFAPHMFILVLILSIIGSGRYASLNLLLFLQLICYFLAMLGSQGLKKFYPFTYFVVIHAALFWGFIKYVVGTATVGWTPPKR